MLLMCSVYLYCICTSVYYIVGSEIVGKYTVRYFPYSIFTSEDIDYMVIFRQLHLCMYVHATMIILQ
jgi:hypothetical protein